MQIMVKAATPRIRRTTADIRDILGVIKNNLLLLAVLTAALGLLVPSAGIAPEACISPLLALRMLPLSEAGSPDKVKRWRREGHAADELCAHCISKHQAPDEP